MTRTAATLTALCLLSAVAAAQSAQGGPTGDAEPGATDADTEPPPENPPPTDQPLIEAQITAIRDETPNAGYDDGFFIRTDDEKFLLKISGRVQPFFNYTYDRATKDSQPQVEVRRSRLLAEGNLNGKSIEYRIQLDFGRGNVILRDARADVNLTGDVWLRAGQWKRPFSRQRINSSGQLEMTDRSVVVRTFEAGRDVGIAIRNSYEDSPEIEWTIGVFNGRGEVPELTGTVVVDPTTGMGTIVDSMSTNVPDELRPAVVGRLGYNTKGLDGYSEADLEGGPARFGAALSVWLEGDVDDDSTSQQKVQADYVLKANGFSTTGGVYFMTEQDGASLVDQASSLFAFHVQAGYMLTPKWQTVARYSYVGDVTLKRKTERDQQEIAVTGNFFGVGHDAKLQAGLRLLKEGAGTFTDAVLFELGACIAF